MGHRVFLVDAEASSRGALERLLRNRGFDVGVADRWDRLHRAFSEESWDLLMADPPQSVDFTGALLRFHEAWPCLPIFLLTPHARHEVDLDRIRPVCRRIFEKPVDVAMMNDALRDLFPGN